MHELLSQESCKYGKYMELTSASPNKRGLEEHCRGDSRTYTQALSTEEAWIFDGPSDELDNFWLAQKLHLLPILWHRFGEKCPTSYSFGSTELQWRLGSFESFLRITLSRLRSILTVPCGNIWIPPQAQSRLWMLSMVWITSSTWKGTVLFQSPMWDRVIFNTA